MSLVNYTVRCDWPDCQSVVTVSDYPSALCDRNWASDRCPYSGPHLCSAHRFTTFSELEEARTNDLPKS